MGLPLPDELIGLSFNHLDVPSLFACMRVCKLFYSIISASSQLAYKIELFASYMVDNDGSSMDTIKRIGLLREHNRVWNEMEWPSSGVIPMRNGNCWEFLGGILAHSTDDNELFLVQLPCNLKGIHERRWSVPFDFRIRDFTLDHSQDLIVLLELAGNSCKIHLRTFSGEQHPCAAVAQMMQTLENPDFSFMIQICGDHLAILIYGLLGASQDSFVVWNWRSGHQEVHIRASDFQSFAFMTEDLILAGILTPYMEPVLRVLSIAAFTNLVHSSEGMPYICELQYPELVAGTRFFLIRSEPTPSWRTPAGSGIPFHYSCENFIFSVLVRNILEQSTVLIVPLSTLLLEVERSHNVPHRSVVWSEWGPSGTRMIYMPKHPPSETWVCYTYGMKFIQRRNKRQVDIYDFSPCAARKLNVKAWGPIAARYKPSDWRKVTEDEVITSLPGCVATFSLTHSKGGWEAVMIGEDHILMVQPASMKYNYLAM